MHALDEIISLDESSRASFALVYRIPDRSYDEVATLGSRLTLSVSPRLLDGLVKLDFDTILCDKSKS